MRLDRGGGRVGVWTELISHNLTCLFPAFSAHSIRKSVPKHCHWGESETWHATSLRHDCRLAWHLSCPGIVGLLWTTVGDAGGPAISAEAAQHCHPGFSRDLPSTHGPRQDFAAFWECFRSGAGNRCRPEYDR